MMENYWKETLDVIIIPSEHACETDLPKERMLETDSQCYLVLPQADLIVFNACRFSSLTMFLFSFLHSLFFCLTGQKYKRKPLFHFDFMTVYYY